MKALDHFFVLVREVSLERRSERVNDLGQGFLVLLLAAFVPVDSPSCLLAGIIQVLDFGLERIDFGKQSLVLGGERLNLLAAHLDEFSMTLLFGIMERFFAGSFQLDSLYLPADKFYGFLRKSKNTA